MPRPVRHPRIGSLLIGLLLLGIGLYLSLMAVAEMLMNAVYLRESTGTIAVVEDVRQKPFGSIATAFDHGYITWGSSIAYQPIVSFTLADDSRARMPLPDLSDSDYKRGESIEVRVPRDDWRKSREYRARFFWGAPALSLLLGLICAWCGKTQLSIRSLRLRAERGARNGNRPASPNRPTPSPRSAGATPRPAQAASRPSAPAREPEPARKAPAAPRRVERIAERDAESPAEKSAEPAPKPRRTRSSSGSTKSESKSRAKGSSKSGSAKSGSKGSNKGGAKSGTSGGSESASKSSGASGDVPARRRTGRRRSGADDGPEQEP